MAEAFQLTEQKAPRDYLEKRTIALKKFESLEEALTELAHLVRDVDGELPAYCANLPYREQGQKAPEIIEPVHLNNRRARETAADMLCSLRNAPDQDIATVQRLAGALAASPETIALAKQVNSLKEAFAKAVGAIADSRQVRHREIGRVVKKINLLQCYRQIKVLEERPSGIAFTWARTGGATKRLTVEEAMARVRQARENPPIEMADQKHWEAMADAALRKLATLPLGERIGFREPVAPHPRANVFSMDGRTKMHNLSLPLLYPQAKSTDELPVTQLGTLDMRLPRVRRRTSIYEPEPISAVFGLYRRTAKERARDSIG